MLKKLLEKIKGCQHQFTDHIFVSGYGYTEYEIWFCKKCPKIFGIQIKNFNQ